MEDPPAKKQKQETKTKTKKETHIKWFLSLVSPNGTVSNPFWAQRIKYQKEVITELQIY